MDVDGVLGGRAGSGTQLGSKPRAGPEKELAVNKPKYDTTRALGFLVGSTGLERM